MSENYEYYWFLSEAKGLWNLLQIKILLAGSWCDDMGCWNTCDISHNTLQNVVTWKTFCITGPLWGESIGGFPSQRASNAESISMSYCHHTCTWCCCAKSCHAYLWSLKHWCQDKMAAIYHTFLKAYSSMKMYEFQLKFHWSLFPIVQLTISLHWFR